MTQNRFTLGKPLWVLLFITALCAMVVQLFIPSKSYFVFDSVPAFFALVGIAVPFLLVVVSRIAGFILRRDPDFWRRPYRRKKEEDA